MADYDVAIIDAGGDDLLQMTNPTPERIAAALEELRRQRAARLAQATTGQRALLAWWAGGHAIHATRLAGGLRIWLQAPPLEATLQRERELGADREELAGLEAIAASGLIVGRFYSAAVPDGELGSAHVCDLEPISRADFGLAREAGWRLPGQEGSLLLSAALWSFALLALATLALGTPWEALGAAARAWLATPAGLWLAGALPGLLAGLILGAWLTVEALRPELSHPRARLRSSEDGPAR